MEKLLSILSKHLTIKDLPKEIQWLAEEIGFEATLILVWKYAGMLIYVTKNSKTHLKKIYVRRSYNGRNIRELSLVLGVTERTIYKWIKPPLTAL